MCAVGLTPIGIPMLGRWWMTPVACWGRRSSGPVSSGYVQLERWLRFWGPLVQAGVEGTGSYGAGLARHLNAAGVEMVEVMRPNRQLRRLRDKTDTVDAEAAARAALSGLATARPKAGDGPVEGINGVPPMCWTLGLCGRVMVVVVLPFVWWLLSDRGVKPTWVVPGFDPPSDR